MLSTLQQLFDVREVSSVSQTFVQLSFLSRNVGRHACNSEDSLQIRMPLGIPFCYVRAMGVWRASQYPRPIVYVVGYWVMLLNPSEPKP